MVCKGQIMNVVKYPLGVNNLPYITAFYYSTNFLGWLEIGTVCGRGLTKTMTGDMQRQPQNHISCIGHASVH